MARRVVKQSRDWYGAKKSANEVIKEFLASGKDCMFGEIRSHLEKNGVSYSKKGLHLRLESLIKQEIIEKRTTDLKPYPTYHLAVKGNDMSFLGWWFRHYMQEIRWHRIKSPIYVNKLDEKLELRVMTTLIGVYALFAEIQSWKLISSLKSFNENFDIRSSFLSEALPLLTASSQNEFRQRNLNEGIELNDDTKFVPGMYKENDFRNMMFEYEKFLEKRFPVEYRWCKEAYEAAKEAVKVIKIKYPN